MVGPWPIVRVNDQGKARIQEFRDIRNWLDKHEDLLVKHFEKQGLLSA